MGETTRMADFLGCGWKFPPKVSPVTGKIETSAGEEDIAEAVRLILFTGKGERAMQPEFGCNIRRYAFSSLSLTDQKSMEEEITQALIRWEPRIKRPEVCLDREQISDGILKIEVRYIVRTTNNPYNMVFPFYLNEGGGTRL